MPQAHTLVVPGSRVLLRGSARLRSSCLGSCAALDANQEFGVWQAKSQEVQVRSHSRSSESSSDDSGVSVNPHHVVVEVFDGLPAQLEEDGVDIVAGHVGGWRVGSRRDRILWKSSQGCLGGFVGLG